MSNQDVVRFAGGPLDGQTLGIAPWPPPELLLQEGGIYERARMSTLTDEQMQDMTHVVRGAEYVWRSTVDVSPLSTGE